MRLAAEVLIPALPSATQAGLMPDRMEPQRGQSPPLPGLISWRRKQTRKWQVAREEELWGKFSVFWKTLGERKAERRLRQLG